MSLDAIAPRTGARACAWYVAITVVFTWPVAAGLSRDVPGDLGDPLLNCWIIGWNTSHFLRVLGGDLAAWRDLWHANIFYPDRYVLTYSELLIAQSVQALPVYAFTRNLVLAYNLLFLSTFAVSGLGTFLLVRAYTRDWRSAFLAGLLFAFMPYRINQLPHLQVMSSHWMPLALYGFHRFASARSTGGLLGGALALSAQNLSCGYFLIYFSLFVPFFVVFEVVRAGTWREPRTWVGVAMAAALVAALTLPFMQPYFAVREMGAGRRRAEEISFFSADALGWATADTASALWGSTLRLSERPEGALFPGLTPLLLATVAIVAAVRRTRLADGSRTVSRWALPRRAARVALSPIAFALAAALVAGWLSLGPQPRWAGRPMPAPPVYEWLLVVVPGLDALRVPARFATIGVLFLTVTAGFGARDLLAWSGRRAAAVMTLVAALWMMDAWAAPLPVNASVFTPSPGVFPPPTRVAAGARPPAVYRAVADLPADAVLLEFPLGHLAWDVQSVYYSTWHWRALVNGFSGHIPPRYARLAATLGDPWRHPGDAWAALRATGATHVVVHGQAYATRQPPTPYAWLESQGATVMWTHGLDTIYRIGADPGTESTAWNAPGSSGGAADRVRVATSGEPAAPGRRSR